MTLYEAFKDHVKERLYWKPRDPVIVAVSGGVDSIVLFDLLTHLPQEYKPKLVIAHINHHLRGESDEEEAFIRHLANQSQTPLHVYQWHQDNHPDTGIEKAARDVRYQFFSEVAEKENSSHVLTAHHQDDQVETILMRWARGGTLEELTGIPEMRKSGRTTVLRLLLPFSKKEIIRHAQENGLEWREDESNASLDYSRNRFRNKILPLLKEENQAIEKHILSFSNDIAAVLELLAPLIHKEREKTIDLTEEEIRIEIPDFMTLKRSMRKSVLNDAFLKWNDSESYIIKQTHLDLLIDWLEKGSPHSSFDLPNDLIAERVYNQCVIKQKQKKGNQPSPLVEKGIPIYSLNKWVSLNENEKIGLFSPSLYEQMRSETSQAVFLNKDAISFPLTARHRKDGDRLSLKGSNGSKKVKDIFIDQKVPMLERNRAWIIEDNSGKVIWVINYKESALSLDPLTDTISYVLVYEKK
ncbi:tRNA lysidine(34) synthetase TilS [Alkalibacterium iburiense]|uniref:tRNA(Ile)-lysidine synthase n=1 Tax=Alkalibacterium iburiense TaxID=290589 RepID=A0ABN0XN43_9LACT